MKFSKIKEGQRVVVVNVDEVNSTISSIGESYIGKVALVKTIDESDKTARVTFVLDDGETEDLWVFPSWIQPHPEVNSHNFYISSVNMKRIYDIACSEWKTKLKDQFIPFETQYLITTEFAEEMLSSATHGQKPVVESVLSESGYKLKQDAFFNFGESREITLEYGSESSPLYIRRTHASDGTMQDKEIGFSPNFIATVVISGVKHVIDPEDFDDPSAPNKGCYISFKSK
jgi:hypothetical protein